MHDLSAVRIGMHRVGLALEAEGHSEPGSDYLNVLLAWLGATETDIGPFYLLGHFQDHRPRLGVQIPCQHLSGGSLGLNSQAACVR